MYERTQQIALGCANLARSLTFGTNAATPGRRWTYFAAAVALASGALYGRPVQFDLQQHSPQTPDSVALRPLLRSLDAFLLGGRAVLAEGLTRVSFEGGRVLSEAQAAVLALWNTLPEEGTVLEKPRVTLRQDTLSVQLSLTGNVDAMQLLLELAKALSHQTKLNYCIQDADLQLKMGDGQFLTLLRFGCVHENSVLSIQVTIPLSMEGHPEIEVLKRGALTEEDLSLLQIVLHSTAKAATSPGPPGRRFDRRMQSSPDDDLFEEIENRMREFVDRLPLGFDPDPPQLQIQQRSQRSETAQDRPEGLIEKLQTMGAIVYRPNPTDKLDWGTLAGYEVQKRRIEDGLLLPLLHPDVSNDIAKKTRKHYTTNRPRGVLFEGPPGTGKTTSARLIASQAAVHLIYLPLEAILSKWYGESEKLLSEAFKLAEQLGGSILFFDEIETLGTKRNDDMHEASRRLLSVLLREMDGFDVDKRIIVIGATNRKQDVDPALLSRFDATVVFDLPDTQCRASIFKQYAQQLEEVAIAKLAKETERMSGRDIRDICEATERSWASAIVRGEIPRGQLPGLPQYLVAVSERQRGV